VSGVRIEAIVTEERDAIGAPSDEMIGETGTGRGARGEMIGGRRRGAPEETIGGQRGVLEEMIGGRGRRRGVLRGR